MMNRLERERQILSSPLAEDEVARRKQEGWRMVAVEWERETSHEQEARPDAIPFGLRLSPETANMEINPLEWDALTAMMELTVQEGPYWSIAEELNRRGYRTREGKPWTSVSVFQMLPRLIEIGPRLFGSEEWQRRKAALQGR